MRQQTGKGKVRTRRSSQSVDASQSSLFSKGRRSSGGAGLLEDTTTSHLSLRPSRLGLGVLVVLTGVVTVASLGVRSVVRNQEKRLLRERAGEVALVLTTAFNGVKSSFPVLAMAPQSSVSGQQPPFADMARPLLANGVVTVGVAEGHDGVLTVLASAGDGPVPGQTLAGDRASLGRRALGAQNLVSGFLAEGPGKRLSISLASGSPRRVVVYEESLVDATRPVPTPRGSPFSELN